MPTGSGASPCACTTSRPRSAWPRWSWRRSGRRAPRPRAPAPPRPRPAQQRGREPPLGPHRDEPGRPSRPGCGGEEEGHPPGARRRRGRRGGPARPRRRARGRDRGPARGRQVDRRAHPHPQDIPGRQPGRRRPGAGRIEGPRRQDGFEPAGDPRSNHLRGMSGRSVQAELCGHAHAIPPVDPQGLPAPVELHEPQPDRRRPHGHAGGLPGATGDHPHAPSGRGGGGMPGLSSGPRRPARRSRTSPTVPPAPGTPARHSGTPARLPAACPAAFPSPYTGGPSSVRHPGPTLRNKNPLHPDGRDG